MKVTSEEQKTIDRLNASWIWPKDWVDSSFANTAGRIVKFSREVDIDIPPTSAFIHISADTRYKLFINGTRVAVGPSRGSPTVWYYDRIDIGAYLREGRNILMCLVVRYFASSRGAMPFERTSFPGLTIDGIIHANGGAIDLSTNRDTWQAQIHENILFPTGLVDDVFLHIYERVTLQTPLMCQLQNYGFKTLNGDLLPWRLRPRMIPMPEESITTLSTHTIWQSSLSLVDWNTSISSESKILLPAGSTHQVDIKADVHSTAFLKWSFKASKKSVVKLRVTYSEGYELEPRSYPFFRIKRDRLNSKEGHLIGPCDCATLEIPEHGTAVYEPFWFRTFRIFRAEITVGDAPVELLSIDATQTNYPLTIKGFFREPSNLETAKIWDISVRTMRNCMFDGYSDCPFYEQLQYSMDSRSVGLFHYLLTGDDRLMRQAITIFASSVSAEGLTQSRVPSHTNQLIAAFPLYWILEVCDHHLYFGDALFARSFLPRIDGVLDFFDTYVDNRGLVSGLPDDVWQFVDWVTSWGATDTYPDKGVPTAGRNSNLHTYFSMVLAYVLDQAAKLVKDVGRPGYAEEYKSRSRSLKDAIRKHCYDGQFFTDSTADIADESSYSQHCQVWGVLSGAAAKEDHVRLLKESWKEGSGFSKCSYMMMFYAFRAFAEAGDDVYEQSWVKALRPWHHMLASNLTTCEEDDVRQRSDCHAWSCVPIYEYCTELAGVQPIAPGSKKILFKPRLTLSDVFEANIALGSDNAAYISWNIEGITVGKREVQLRLEKAISVTSQLPGGDLVDHGTIDHLCLSWAA